MFHHSTTVLPPARAEIATPDFLETLEPVRQWAISFDTSKYPGKLRAKHLSVTEDIECTGINHQNCHVNRLNMVTNQWISDKPMWGLKAIYGLGLCRCITRYHWSNSPQVIALVPSIPPGSRHLPTPPTRQAEDWCSACRRTWPPQEIGPNSRNRPGHLKSYRPGHGKNGLICFFQIKLVDHLSWTILDPMTQWL